MQASIFYVKYLQILITMVLVIKKFTKNFKWKQVTTYCKSFVIRCINLHQSPMLSQGIKNKFLFNKIILKIGHDMKSIMFDRFRLSYY